jgi:hypothetical protein
VCAGVSAASSPGARVRRWGWVHRGARRRGAVRRAPGPRSHLYACVCARNYRKLERPYRVTRRSRDDADARQHRLEWLGIAIASISTDRSDIHWISVVFPALQIYRLADKSRLSSTSSIYEIERNRVLIHLDYVLSYISPPVLHSLTLGQGCILCWNFSFQRFRCRVPSLLFFFSKYPSRFASLSTWPARLYWFWITIWWAACLPYLSEIHRVLCGCRIGRRRETPIARLFSYFTGLRRTTNISG